MTTPVDFSEFQKPKEGQGAVSFTEFQGPQIGVVPADVTRAAPSGRIVSPLVSEAERQAGRVYTFDELMDKLLAGQTMALEAPSEIKAISQPYLGIKGFGRGVRTVEHAALHPLETIAGIAEAPFIIGYNAFKELATQSGIGALLQGDIVGFADEETRNAYQQKAKDLLGDMTPDEAKEARRAFYAFSMMFPAGAAGGLAGGAAATRFGLTGLARTAVTSQAAAQSGAAALTILESDSPDKAIEKGITYGMLALPLAAAHTLVRPAWSKATGIELREGVESALDLASERRVRAFDDLGVAREVEVVRPSASREVPDVLGGTPEQLAAAELKRTREGLISMIEEGQEAGAPPGALAELSRRLERVIAEEQGLVGESGSIPRIVQRIEEGQTVSDVSKPQGLYTSPGEVESPHAGLGGAKTTFSTNPKANVLQVDASDLVRTNRGLVGKSAGIAALEDILPRQEFERVLKLPQQDLIQELSAKYPQIDWNRYFDAQEVLEGYAGLLARERGFDAIWAVDKQSPQFNEYVALTERAFSNKPLHEHTPEAEQQAVKGKLPAQQEISANETVLRNFVDSDLDIVSTIIRSAKELNPDGVSLITGARDPSAAVRLIEDLMPDAVFAIHKREGGFDIAIGGPKSALKGSQAQFASEGHYAGETVGVNGKYYTYKTQITTPEGEKFALVRDPSLRIADGDPTSVRIPWQDVRRAGWLNEYPVESVSLDQMKEVLTEPGEFEAYKELANYMNPKDGVVPEPPLETIAASNGMIVEDAIPGVWIVRDAETGRVLVQKGFRSESAAKEYINLSEQATGPDFIRSGDNIPPDVPINGILNSVNPPTPPGGGRGLMENFQYPRGSGFIRWIQDAMAGRMQWFTDAKTRFEFLDRTYGTDWLNKVYFPTQKAAVVAGDAMLPWLKRAKEIDVRAGKMNLDAARREILGKYLEAMSAEEMLDVGLQLDRKLTTQEIGAAKRLAANQIDNKRIYKFRRELREKIAKAARAEDVPVRDFPQKEKESIQRGLEAEYRLTPEEKSAVSTYEFILTQDMNEMSLANVTRLADAMLRETPSRAEFAKEHNITGEERKLVSDIEDIFAEGAKEFGIEDVRMLRNFMAHIREYAVGDANSAFLSQTASGKAGQIRRFVSEFSRSGEIDAYIRDPIINLATYLRSGFENKYLIEAWENARETIRVDGRSLKLGEDITGQGNQYLNDMRGFPSAAVERTQQLFEKFLDFLGVKKNINFQKDIVNNGMAFHSASALAFRVGLGARDFYDIMIRHGSKVGFQRAYDSLVASMKPEVRAALNGKGVITHQNVVEFGVPGETRAGSRLTQFSQKGLEASLQPAIHEWAQASAYMDMWHTVPEYLNKVQRGTMTKQKAYERIKVDTFDKGVVDEFDRLASDGKIEDAADYLGRVAAIELAGRFGLGNNPYGWRSNLGRLAGQFGTWSVYTRTFMLRNLANGTFRNRAAFAARFGVSQAALFATGKFFGLNLSRWYTLPGLVFTGGPLVQFAQHAANIAGGSFSDRQRAFYAFEQLIPSFSDPRSLYLPGSYFLSDWIRAFTDKEVRDAFQGGARAIGIPVSKERPMWHEF